MNRIAGIGLLLASIVTCYCCRTVAGEQAVTAGAPRAAGDVVVTVDCGKVLHTMLGGMGASWHAMENPIPYGVKHLHQVAVHHQ
jgi:hypothetical protein